MGDCFLDFHSKYQGAAGNTFTRYAKIQQYKNATDEGWKCASFLFIYIKHHDEFQLKNMFHF